MPSRISGWRSTSQDSQPRDEKLINSIGGTYSRHPTRTNPPAHPAQDHGETRHASKATTNGGAIVAAGSIRGDGQYRVIRAGAIADLPEWLRRALTPPPPPTTVHLEMPPKRASAYVRAIVDDEVDRVATAAVGTRHHSLLKAALTLGRLVGGGELALPDARGALLDAAARHIGVHDCTAHEVRRTIEDGITYGMRLPRRISRGHLSSVDGGLGRHRPGPAR